MRRNRDNWLSLAFFFTALFVGTALALLVPAGGGLDEAAHVARTYQISKGQLLPKEVDADNLDTRYSVAGNPDYVLYGDDKADEALVTIGIENATEFHLTNTHYTLPTWQNASILSEGNVDESYITFAFSNTVVNCPVVYLPQALSYRIGRLFTRSAYALITVMRIGGVLFYAAGIALALRIIPVGKYTLAALSLLPNALATNSAVTADTFSYVSVALFVAVLLRTLFASNVEKRQTVELLITGCLVALSKTPYLPIVFLVWLLPVLKTNRPTSPTRRKDLPKRATLIKQAAIVSACATLFTATWYLSVLSINSCAVFVNHLTYPEKQMAYIMQNPLRFISLATVELLHDDWFALRECTTLAAHSGFVYSGIFTVVAITVSFSLDMKELFAYKNAEHLSSACVDAESPSITQRAISILGCLLVLTSSAYLLILGVYTQFNEVGADHIDGIQNRYFHPLLIVLFVVLGLICTFVIMREAPKSRAHSTRTSEPAPTTARTPKPATSKLLVGVLWLLMFVPIAEHLIIIY